MAANEPAEVQHLILVQDARIGGSDVVGAYLRSLIGVAEIVKNRVRRSTPADNVRDVEIIVRIGVLEPGAGVVEVRMNRVVRRDLVVDPVEYILFVALGVEHLELRRIEESPGV